MKGGSEYCVSMSKLRTSPAVTPRACLHPLSVVQYSIDLCSRSDFCTLVFYFAVYVLFIARRRFSWCLKHVQRRRLSQLCCHASYFHIVIFFIDFHIYCKCPMFIICFCFISCLHCKLHYSLISRWSCVISVSPVLSARRVSGSL